jgi:ABC-type nitrate/sulfonate/bicarbonate transport system permease component
MMTTIAQYWDYFDPVAAYIVQHWEYFVGQSTGLVIGLVFGFYFGWVKWSGRSYCPTCEVLNDPLLGPSR